MEISKVNIAILIWVLTYMLTVNNNVNINNWIICIAIAISEMIMGGWC